MNKLVKTKGVDVKKWINKFIIYEKQWTCKKVVVAKKEFEWGKN